MLSLLGVSLRNTFTKKGYDLKYNKLLCFKCQFFIGSGLSLSILYIRFFPSDELLSNREVSHNSNDKMLNIRLVNLWHTEYSRVIIHRRDKLNTAGLTWQTKDPTTYVVV